MKYSQFNSIVFIDDNYVLYNTLSNNAVVLDPMLKDLLQAAKAEGVDELVDIHPSFFEALCEKQFLVENDLDEVQIIKDISRAVDNGDDTYHLTINPTMNCNFKCWYCYETHIKASRMNEEISERINTFLTNTIDTKPRLKAFVLAWFGGEPLLYYDDIVLPIIQHFNSLIINKRIDYGISFTTNGFLITQAMIDSFKENRVTSLQITLDGYGPEHDLVRYVSATRGSYDKIIENVVLLVRNKITVRLRINFTSVNIKNAHKIINDLLVLGPDDMQYIGIDFHRVWQDTNGTDDEYFQKQFDVFRNAGFMVFSNHSMNNVKEPCYADKKNSAVVNYNGDVFKCTARDFTTFKRDGFIDENGEIIWENGSLEKRMDAKFKNKPCLSCRLLPVCNGGCSQHAVENVDVGGEYCIFDFDEKRRDAVVVEKIKELLEFA